MTHSALVVVADGSEEIEFSATVDVLARGGFTVTTASVMPSNRSMCKLSRGIKVEADVHISKISHDSFDVVVVPGGMPGAKHCADSVDLINILRSQKNRGGWYAAICASPAVVFSKIADNQKMVCYDYKDFNDVLINNGNMGTGRVAVSGKCITSVGPGSAIDFALAIVECLVGKSKADQVAIEMMVLERAHPVIQ